MPHWPRWRVARLRDGEGCEKGEGCAGLEKGHSADVFEKGNRVLGPLEYYMVLCREAGAKLWSVRLFGVSRRPGGRRKPLESPAGFNLQRGRRRLAAAGRGRPSLILQQQHQQQHYSYYIHYYMLILPFKTFQIVQNSEFGIFLGKTRIARYSWETY